jgi:hypothetical protein
MEGIGQVVIASRLSDGLVVFVRESAAAGRVDWVLQLADAEVADSDARAAVLLEMALRDAGERQSVVDAYLIDVKEESGRLCPTKYREAIRCFGPTIRTDLGEQAESSSAAEK